MVSPTPHPPSLTPHMEQWAREFGVWGVAAAAFVGATLVPVSSEVAVVAALRLGVPAWQVFVSASIGNALGASVNYGLGLLFAERTRRSLAGSRGGRRALHWVDRFGPWSLWGSWLPVVGDPLCLAAGLFRFPLRYFLLLGLGTRVARYLVLIALLAESG